VSGLGNCVEDSAGRAEVARVGELSSGVKAQVGRNQHDNADQTVPLARPDVGYFASVDRSHE